MIDRLFSLVQQSARQWATYFAFVARRSVEDRCLTVAGSLTFTTLLALVPLFTVTLTLTSKLSYTRDLVLQLKSFVLKNFVPDMASKLIGSYVDQFALNASRLTVIGLVLVLATAIALLFTIENTFNDIWRARRKRSWARRLRWALMLLVLGPLLIAVSLSLSLSIVKLSRGLESSLPWLDDSLLRAIPWLTTTMLMYMAYRWVPNRFVPARHAIVGAVIAALLFELMKIAFVLYVSKVPTYNVVYGAFASVPVFLIWIFLCWLVVLVGAEVAATLSYVRHTDAQGFHQDQDAYIERLLSAAVAADSPRTFEQLRAAAPMPIDIAEDALHTLLDRGLLQVVERSKPLRYRAMSASV